MIDLMRVAGGVGARKRLRHNVKDDEAPRGVAGRGSMTECLEIVGCWGTENTEGLSETPLKLLLISCIKDRAVDLHYRRNQEICGSALPPPAYMAGRPRISGEQCGST